MIRRGLVLISIYVMGYTVSLAPWAAAWSNGGYSADPDNPDYGTHDWIGEAALTIQVKDVTFLADTYHSLFLLGTEAPDNPDYIGDSVNHHVYFYSTGEVQDDVCAVRAAAVYQTALDYLLAGDLGKAAYDIGVMAHYISDPGVFGHTMGVYTDWGGEVHHSDYENEFESRLDSLSIPSMTVLEDKDAYTATLELAEKVTFGQNQIESNVWMDVYYSWSDSAFVASALASLNASVAAVASVINHLMTEAESEPPPPEPSPEPSPEPPLPLPPEPEVPGPPASLTASVLDNDIVLMWAPPLNDGGSEVTGYVLWRGTGPDYGSPLASVPANIFSWTDESAEEGVTYYYWTAAENAVGVGEASEVASAMIPEGSNTFFITVIVACLSAAGAIGGGAVVWRRRVRDRAGP